MSFLNYKGVFKTCLLGIGMLFGEIKAQEKSDIAVIPYPVEVNVSTGYFKVTEKFKIGTNGFLKENQNLQKLSAAIVKTFGAKNIIQEKKSINNELLLILDKSLSLPEEGYKLSIKKTGITISSPSERGIFYALQSLIQLYNNEVAGFPFIEIKDYPRYAYRGLHLDVGRHFFPVSFIKEYIDVLAHYKLNTFHWHLTEDQGWRIEIKKYPKLAEVAAFRNQTLTGHGRKPPLQYDGKKYGGFYTQDEIKEVVAYAASKYVTVIPEIEMPGHSVAALAAYPELACGKYPGPFKTYERWGVTKDVYCAGKENTFQFLTDVLDEVIALFPSQYLHIGGDECPKDQWKTCTHCQQRIKDEGLKNEDELQSYFIRRIEKHLNARGRSIIGWDEILDGGIAPNATVMSWRGTKGGIAAAKQKHHVIMTPDTHLYFDHRESRSEEEPVVQGGYSPLEKVYAYDPTPKDLNSEEQKYIRGVQANVWTEYMKTPDKVWYMLFPRIYALSEIAWTPLSNKNWNRFSEDIVPLHLAKRDAEGKRYRVPSPIGVKEETLKGEKFTISLKSPVKGASVYYTMDSYTPYDFDNLYQDELTINVPKGEEILLKTVTISPSGKRSVVINTHLKNE